MSEYQPSPFYFNLDGEGKKGLYYQPPAKKSKQGETEIPSPVWICSPFDVVARSRDTDSGNHGIILEWRDQDKVRHEWVLPFELLAGDGVEIRKFLMNGGLKISTQRHAKELLTRYLSEVTPKRVARSVFAIGWQPGCVYVLPNQTIGG